MTRIRPNDLLTVTRMTHANMTGSDRQFTQLVGNPIYRWLSYLTLPFYFMFAGQGFKAVYKEVLIGCAFLHLRGTSGYIFNVSVNRPYRRQGVGRILMTHLEKVTRSQGRGWLALQVDSGNQPARRLYEQLGYHPYHEKYLCWDGQKHIIEEDDLEVGIEPLFGIAGRRQYLHYQRAERKADRWPLELAEELENYETRLGRYQRCLAAGQEVGCAWWPSGRNQSSVRLALLPELWGSEAAIALVRRLVAGVPVAYDRHLDLRLASSAHAAAIAPILEGLGFKKQTESRITMLKKVGTAGERG